MVGKRISPGDRVQQDKINNSQSDGVILDGHFPNKIGESRRLFKFKGNACRSPHLRGLSSSARRKLSNFHPTSYLRSEWPCDSLSHLGLVNMD